VLIERIQPFRNRDFARAAGIKSAEAKRRNKVAAAEHLATAKAMIAAAVPIVVAGAANADSFVQDRLDAVRRQIIKLDAQIDAALEAKTLDARLLADLAAAKARFCTQEQQLAGRPLPGSRRPGRERRGQPLPTSGPGGAAEPID
jgi:hypothetical protein